VFIYGIRLHRSARGVYVSEKNAVFLEIFFFFLEKLPSPAKPCAGFYSYYLWGITGGSPPRVSQGVLVKLIEVGSVRLFKRFFFFFFSVYFRKKKKSDFLSNPPDPQEEFFFQEPQGSNSPLRGLQPRGASLAKALSWAELDPYWLSP
jgi:hypothetical protein